MKANSEFIKQLPDMSDGELTRAYELNHELYMFAMENLNAIRKERTRRRVPRLPFPRSI